MSIDKEKEHRSIEHEELQKIGEIAHSLHDVNGIEGVSTKAISETVM